MSTTNAKRRRAVRAAALVVGLGPLAALVARGLLGGPDGLGANPVETITHQTGEWALRLLLLSLAVTPARRWLGWSWLAPERRTFGLLAFGYACLHFATWLVLDLELDFAALLEDVLERPYVTAGMTSLAAMLPLAVTSTRGWMKRLGRRWTRLHRLVWLAAAAACLHFLWLVKADHLEPALHLAVLAALLALRAARGPDGRNSGAAPRSGEGRSRG